MENKSAMIRSAVSLIGDSMRRHDELVRGERMSEAEQREFDDFEFLISNLLVDIHTIALAHAPAVERSEKSNRG